MLVSPLLPPSTNDLLYNSASLLVAIAGVSLPYTRTKRFAYAHANADSDTHNKDTDEYLDEESIPFAEMC